MRKIFDENKKKIIVLVVLLAFYAILHLLRQSVTIMNAITTYFTAPVRRFAAWVFSVVPFSVAECIWAVGIVWVLVYLVRSVVVVVRKKGSRAATAVKRVCTLAVLAAIICVSFDLLFGTLYYGTQFEEKAGITPQPVSVQQLQETAQFFADKLNETAGNVKRDEQGLFAESREDILANSVDIYTALETQYPFLTTTHVRTKPLFASSVFSAISFTGFYFPYTGEANVNVASPACLLAATVAHEQAHQRNIAPEQTCNFLAVLACESSGNAVYAYSGWLMGYIHTINALYSADKDAWRTVATSLCDAVNADLEDNNAYWRQFESPVQEISNATYDSFLKGYDQTLGMKSYGACVDLLVAYYGNDAARHAQETRQGGED